MEVACALEGLAHCLEASMAQAAEDASSGAGGSAGQEPEQEARRLELYAECARIAAEFLLEAQVRAGVGGLGGGARRSVLTCKQKGRGDLPLGLMMPSPSGICRPCR